MSEHVLSDPLRLQSEFDKLNKEHQDAMTRVVFVGMTSNEIMKYKTRQHRITQLAGLLAKMRSGRHEQKDEKEASRHR